MSQILTKYICSNLLFQHNFCKHLISHSFCVYMLPFSPLLAFTGHLLMLCNQRKEIIFWSLGTGGSSLEWHKIVVVIFFKRLKFFQISFSVYVFEPIIKTKQQQQNNQTNTPNKQSPSRPLQLNPHKINDYENMIHSLKDPQTFISPSFVQLCWAWWVHLLTLPFQISS